MKLLRQMFRFVICLLVFRAQAGNVWVNNAWINGQMKVTAAGEKVNVIDENNLKQGYYFQRDYNVNKGSEKTFIAIVPHGYEVVMWSWEADPFGPTAVNVGHFANTNATDADTFKWSGTSSDMDLAVHLDWLKYTIDFDGNGETSGATEPLEDVIYTNTVTLAANPFEKTGYGFKEWQLLQNTTKTFKDGAKVKGENFGDILSHTNKEMTLVAQWTNNVYAVTFDANGGTFGDTGTKVISETYDANYVLPETDPKRKDYRFEGWTNAVGLVTAETTVKTPADHSLYAKWTWVPPQMKVTFDPGVVSGATLSFTEKTVTCAQKYGDMPTASARGYEFQGWYTTQMGGKEVTKDDVVTEEKDHTLYAHWLALAYQVNLDPVGGSVSPSYVTVTYDARCPALPTPTRKGYTANGWWTARNGGKEVREDDIVTIVKEETPSLFAHWLTNEYTIAFAPNGGTGAAMGPIAMKYDAVTNLPPCTYSNGTRSFIRWIGSDGTTYPDQAVVSNLTAVANATYVLTAEWSDDYVIAFDGNGATSGSMPDQKLATTEWASLTSNAYERIGYTYLGWATNREEAAAWKVRFADGAEVRGLGKAGEEVRLFAVWTNNLYRVKFYSNGGTGVPFEQTFAYDEARQLPPDAFTREGHDLVGWLTDPTNTVAYAPAQVVSNLTTQANAVVPLFAKWSVTAEDLGPYSEAADCDRPTADRDALHLTVGDYCTVVSNVQEKLPGANDQYVCLSPTVGTETDPKTVIAVLKCELPSGKGHCSFHYKVCNQGPCEDTAFSLQVEGLQNPELTVVESTDGWVWYDYVKTSEGKLTLKWMLGTTYNADDHDYVCIDNVAWLPDERDAGTVGVTFRLNDGTLPPADIWSNATYAVGKSVGELPVLAVEGFVGWSTNTSSSGQVDANWIVPATDMQLFAVWSAHPVPGPENAPTIGGFIPTADGFSLSVVTDARFDYRLLSTPALEPPDWKPDGEAKLGTGGAVLFAVPVGGAGQKFFKVEVLQRGAE